MSAIAGMCSRGGAPLGLTALRRIGRGLRPMGPDGERLASSGPIGMIYRPFETGPGSTAVQQPLVTPDGCMLAFDGRLDNADAVRRDLAGQAPKDSPVLELVLTAYRRWGADAFARLIGDFALALWDADRRRLLLCCDALGRRPLYYRVTEDYALWSSRGRPLAEALGLPLEPDQEYAADFLVNGHSTRSPFRGIQALPGAHVLVLDATSAELRRYWSPDPHAEISYRSDEDYERHFLELFTDAVACRLRDAGAVYCELSGGLDSSAIVCVADHLLKAGAVEASTLRTVSYVYNCAVSSDESAYVRQVEERIGRHGLHVAESQGPILRPLPEGFIPDHPSNQLCFLARQDHVTREMQHSGARVLLSGVGGDHLFWSTPPAAIALADHLAQGRVLDVLRDCGHWSRRLRLPVLHTLWLGACRPLVAARWPSLGRPAARLGAWFDRAFARRLDLRARAIGLPDDVRFRRPSRCVQWGLIRQAMRIHALEWCSSEGYVDARYPYLDRRLVEFALAIPFEQSVRPGQTRSIVRRALRDVLPKAVRGRMTKSGPDEAFHRALVREWSWLSTLLSDPRVSAYGFVDREALVSALRQARHGLVTNSVQLGSTIAFELWLRTLEKHPLWTSDADGEVSSWQADDQRGGPYVEEAPLSSA